MVYSTCRCSGKNLIHQITLTGETESKSGLRWRYGEATVACGTSRTEHGVCDHFSLRLPYATGGGKVPRSSNRDPRARAPALVHLRRPGMASRRTRAARVAAPATADEVLCRRETVTSCHTSQRHASLRKHHMLRTHGTVFILVPRAAPFLGAHFDLDSDYEKGIRVKGLK